MKVKSHPNPRSKSNPARVGPDVARARNHFLVDDTLKQVNKALGLTRRRPVSSAVLSEIERTLSDAQQNLEALDAPRT